MMAMAILAGSVLLIGCAETAIGPGAEGPATVAEVVCEADGSTTVLTPEVLAQADGVHVHVVSKLDEPASVGGVGFDADPGEKEWVSHAAPGSVDAACYAYSDHDSGEEPQAAPIEILDPEGFYVDGEIRCDGEMNSSIADFGEVPMSVGPVPLDEAREALQGLDEDDEVLHAGYPEQIDAEVIVRRDLQVVASFSFVTFDGEDWVVEGSTICESSGIRDGY